MSEKELLSQLNKLKDVKPSSDWKNSNREILFSQISRGNSDEEVSGFDIFKNMLPHNMFSNAFQPVLAAVLIVVIVAGGGAVSLSASRGTKPGDSLYIAKIISEKAQLAVTFGNKGKAKLGIEFAGNRAKEIEQVLAEADDIIKEKEAKVEKLSQNFKKEISAVKERLADIDSAKDNSAGKNNQPAEVQDEDMQIFSANLGKTDQRMEIYDSTDDSVDSTAAEDSGDEPAIEDSAVGEPSNAEDVLAEAEKLFDEQDYSGTIDKLTEVNNMIDNADSADETADETADEAVAEEVSEDTASTTDEADETIIN